MDHSLKIIPLGGLGEIGLNMMVVEYDDALMIIDAGVMFPEDYMLGIDVVIPETSYLEDKVDMIKGIVVTHGHEDHIGALPYVAKNLRVPIYATPFTSALVEHKFRSHGLSMDLPLVEVAPRQSVNVGPFEVEFIRVSHSVVDGVGLAISTPVGLIIHSGDFKINQVPVRGEITDMSRFAEYGERGVLALMSDSTNVEHEGYTLSEKEIGEKLHRIFKECSGRIIVALFASNIGRIHEIVRAAGFEGRKVVFCGRSMLASVAIARGLGYLDIPEEMELGIGQVQSSPDSEVVVITTGSQGEPLSVMNRIAMGTHKQIKIKAGDTVILSSKSIPGNERAISHIINRLYRSGAEVIYEKVSDIHVSGHAFQEELKLMINLTNPQYFIPIHGEFRHLVRHAQLAKEVGVSGGHILLAENGRIVTFDEQGGRLGGFVQSGRVLVDGKGVGDVETSVLKERQHLSEDGIVMVILVLDNATGEVLRGPDIESHGFLVGGNRSEILEKARSVVLDAIGQQEERSNAVSHDVEAIRVCVEKALQRYFRSVIQRKPVIFPLVVEV